MGSIWGWQDPGGPHAAPGGPHVGHMNFAILVSIESLCADCCVTNLLPYTSNIQSLNNHIGEAAW